MKSALQAFARGLAIGIANIIPGVSGGTLALALGIYERLINSIRSLFSARILKAALAALTLRPAALREFRAALLAADAPFAALIAAGAAAAIVAASRAMAFVLEHYHPQTYGFFFGLVAVSIVYPYRIVKSRTWKEALCFLAAVGLMLGITAMESDAGKIAKAERKARITLEKQTQPDAPQPGGRGLVSFEHPGARRLAGVFFAAALAVSAMILPGISGSFVLLLLGVYFDVLLAINNREVIFLAVFCLGMVFGLVAVANVLNVFLKKWHDPTMSFMVGLVAGSLVVVWPFKRFADVGGQTVYLGNTFPPGLGPQEAATVLCVLAGAAVVALCLVLENAMRRKAPGATSE